MDRKKKIHKKRLPVTFISYALHVTRAQFFVSNEKSTSDVDAKNATICYESTHCCCEFSVSYAGGVLVAHREKRVGPSYIQIGLVCLSYNDLTFAKVWKILKGKC